MGILSAVTATALESQIPVHLRFVCAALYSVIALIAAFSHSNLLGKEVFKNRGREQEIEYGG